MMISSLHMGRVKACSSSGGGGRWRGEARGLQAELMPKHVGIILDGNGRWAINRGLPLHIGHATGLTTLNSLATFSSDLGIHLLSVYAFSSENWKRSPMEVDFLMRIFEGFVRSELTELITRHDVRFSTIGDTSRLPETLRAALSSAEEMSRGNGGMHFVSALSYSGRNDIVQAAKKIAAKVKGGILRPSDIDETVFRQHLMTSIAQFPDPDLLIRTSGELRISNFYLWQSAFTKFYFSDKLFPDFREPDFVEALLSYQCSSSSNNS